MAIIAVGHKNPDTDTIASAIAIADLWSKVKKKLKQLHRVNSLLKPLSSGKIRLRCSRNHD